jgi:hypothetical protein
LPIGLSAEVPSFLWGDSCAMTEVNLPVAESIAVNTKTFTVTTKKPLRQGVITRY